MNNMTLTLVPFGDHWINPEEIAAIVPTDRYHRAGWRDASHTTPKRS